MTVAVEKSVFSYELNALSGTTFLFSARYFINADLSVYYRTTDGVESLLTITQDYTIAATGPVGSEMDTATITMTTVRTSGRIVIKRRLALTQNVTIPLTGPLAVRLIQEALDRNVLLMQQLDEIIQRAIVSAETEVNGFVLPTREQLKGRALAGDPVTGDLTAVNLLGDAVISELGTELVAKATGSEMLQVMSVGSWAADVLLPNATTQANARAQLGIAASTTYANALLLATTAKEARVHLEIPNIVNPIKTEDLVLPTNEIFVQGLEDNENLSYEMIFENVELATPSIIKIEFRSLATGLYDQANDSYRYIANWTDTAAGLVPFAHVNSPNANGTTGAFLAVTPQMVSSISFLRIRVVAAMAAGDSTSVRMEGHGESSGQLWNVEGGGESTNPNKHSAIRITTDTTFTAGRYSINEISRVARAEL